MQVLSVSQCITYLNETFRAMWDSTLVALEGEVSGYRVSQGQWVNFDVKDDEATLSVFMVLRQLTVPLQDGMRVRLFGFPRIYAKYGKFSFSADRVELIGEGSLRKALQLLRTRLLQEGLFAVTRKRALPIVPRRIALIASRDSAAYGDFVRVLSERWGGIEIDLYHVLVQGKAAVESLISAVQTVSQKGSVIYDALIMTRGGGSLEELMAFNDERLVRALFASTVPTLVAIGHERDVTLVEEVADVRGSTPTDCARRLVPDRQDVMVQLSHFEASLDRGIEGIFTYIGDSIAHVLNGIDRWRERLGQRLQLAEKSLTMADPRHLLRRGYSLIRSSRGLVRQMSDVRSGDALTVQVSDGVIQTLVKGVSDGYDRPQNLQLL